MSPHRYNETSSQPVNDLGGVPAVSDSFGKASARRGYVAVKLAAACNMPWFRKEPAGGRGKFGRTIMTTSAGIRRIALRLMLAFQARCRICNIIMETIGIQMRKN